ncbi:hypothetical protein [Actinomadura sp. NBRC 104425]|uniref:hypothetical protein n=1 Tax=Actinomadura sp. NBRC 104425 TaxID=3032204 RepID=UPI0025568BB2|nr:hypothetical protein [Actinomadura sp. NBRC 104425]
MFFDVAGFGRPDRDADIQQAVRRGLYQIVFGALDRAAVPHTVYYRQDHGDGVLAVLPPTVPVLALAESLPIWQHLEIRRYNKCASPAARIQLRSALHIGPVYRDEQGVSGRALIHAARLIDAPPVRRALADSHADLVFAASDRVYDEVICHHPTPAGVEYRRFAARVKEDEFTAWFTVLGGHADPRLEDRPPLRVVPDHP